MDTTQLIDALKNYGVDIEGVEQRFCGNFELYLICLNDFFEEEQFQRLEQEIKAKNYESAFLPAHTLKGLSGNLGLLSIYKKICNIVESLRNKNYDNIDEEYSDAKNSVEELKKFLHKETSKVIKQ